MDVNDVGAYEKLLDILLAHDFPERFYGLYAQLSSKNEPGVGIRAPELVKLLEETGLKVKFNRRERFFEHVDVRSDAKFELEDWTSP